MLHRTTVTGIWYGSSQIQYGISALNTIYVGRLAFKTKIYFKSTIIRDKSRFKRFHASMRTLTVFKLPY
jgi:hypothetical protein